MARPVSITDVEQELAVRGGLLPLMHLFPDEASQPGSSVPWTPQDVALRDLCASSPAYAAAVAELQHAHAA